MHRAAHGPSSKCLQVFPVPTGEEGFNQCGGRFKEEKGPWCEIPRNQEPTDMSQWVVPED